MIRFFTALVFIALFLSACKENNDVKIELLVKEWAGKTVKIPEVESIIPLKSNAY
jgi:ABC-type Fe3+-hydroxamate transport system substrate-binding protein